MIDAFLIFTVFQRAPPTPPSASAMLAEQPKPNQSSPFLHSIKNLIFNRNYTLLLISYGVNGNIFPRHWPHAAWKLIFHFTVGVFYAISTLLNQIVLFHYPGAEEDAGRIGLCIVVAGMMGSVCCGVVLDKTHRFKWVHADESLMTYP